MHDLCLEVIHNRGESCAISRLTKENKVVDMEVAKTRRLDLVVELCKMYMYFYFPSGLFTASTELVFCVGWFICCEERFGN